jgi:hypothetical protein
MDESMLVVIALAVIIIGAIMVGVVTPKVNDKELGTYIPNVSVDVSACDVCAKQCGWNQTR